MIDLYDRINNSLQPPTRPKPRPIWTTEERSILIENYSTKTDQEISVLLNRSEQSVKSMALNLINEGHLSPVRRGRPVRRNISKSTKWDRTEDGFLYSNSGKLPLRKLSERLSRSEESILLRIKHLRSNGLEVKDPPKKTAAAPYRRYTDKDDAFIKANLSRMSKADIARYLHRTPDSLSSRIEKLGL